MIPYLARDSFIVEMFDQITFQFVAFPFFPQASIFDINYWQKQPLLIIDERWSLIQLELVA